MVWTGKPLARGIAALAVLSGAAAIAAPERGGAQDVPDPFGPQTTCSYVEAGPPGPEGNVLRVGHTAGLLGQDLLHRNGRLIEVSAFGGHTPAVCSGGTPTVDNIDRIRVTAGKALTLDESRGAFEPGATHEKAGSEIEISADLEPSGHTLLEILGTRAANTIEATSLKAGRIGVNLDRSADERSPDLDVVADRAPRLKISGGNRRDLLSGAGLDPFHGKYGSGLFLDGGKGADRILGSAGDDFMLSGGGGRDVIRGGKGRDDLRLGSGSGSAHGGPGPDFMLGTARTSEDAGHKRFFGGRGDDQILSDNFLHDSIRCGPGDDRLVRDPVDRASGCENDTQEVAYCDVSDDCRLGGFARPRFAARTF